MTMKDYLLRCQKVADGFKERAEMQPMIKALQVLSDCFATAEAMGFVYVLESQDNKTQWTLKRTHTKLKDCVITEITHSLCKSCNKPFKLTDLSVYLGATLCAKCKEGWLEYEREQDARVNFGIRR